ncbi:MAG: hypothetical protein A3J27_02375 [Candidatus Tectomicrobia bacterium RIFCSPLOWO2_12_FULL_69_37]|nr:MAG: hypothetical protein A3I72_06720 [Candidatus Tectomicrobia bacterium RIFCSPLOWO2_02_FULL_70_19]OGL62704.1 MAG: hypothetical protein A3J27_02375 [Candidatus Tectomicrobia bacterium RIFCSPLOWO2_12_FULL_69_37]
MMDEPKTPAKRHHDRPMQIRMAQELLDLINRASEKAGLSTSGWVRDRLGRVARRELRGTPDETPRQTYRDKRSS